MFLLQTTGLSELEGGDDDSDGASSRRTHDTTPEQEVLSKMKQEVSMP